MRKTLEPRRHITDSGLPVSGGMTKNGMRARGHREVVSAAREGKPLKVKPKGVTRMKQGGEGCGWSKASRG